MARGPSGTSESDSRNVRRDSLLDRRSYLKAAGIAAGVMAGAAGSAAAAEDADVNIVEAGADDTGNRAINDVLDRVHGSGKTIYFPPGRYLLRSFRTAANDWTWVGEDATIVVPGSENRNYLFFEGDRWTFDNFTIDLTASGAAPINYPRGNDWEFKNVVFEGQMDDPEYRAGSNLLYPNVDSAGATGVIENVIATDGSADPGDSSNRGGLWAGPSNEGHLIVRNSHFRHFANNTLYVANIPGRVTIDGCLIEDSNVGVRIGGNTAVRDTVFDQRGPVPRARWSGGRAARGIWINSNSYVPGDIEVEGCDFLMNGPQGAHAVFSRRRLDGIEIRDCRIHQNGGFTGIEFADGGSGATVIEDTSVVGDSSKPAIRLVDRDGARLRRVCVQKSGPGIELRGSSNVSVEDSNVNVSGQQFTGVAPSTRDVTANESCPAPSSDWDGESEPGDDRDDEDEPAEPEGTEVRLVGTAEYVIEASGEVQPAPEIAEWVEEGDQYGDGRVEWYLTDSETAWYVTGEIETLDVDDPSTVTVYVDGEEVDPETYPSADEDDGEHSLRLDGTAEYLIEVSGEIRPAEEIAEWVEEGEQYGDGWAEWYLTDSWTEWQFTGEIERFELSGAENLDVYLDGDAVDPDDLGADDGDGVPPNRITITGTGTPTEYTFTASGDVVDNPDRGTLEEWDEIDGSTVTGWVTDPEHVDSFRFEGSLTNLELRQGEAEVRVNGVAVDPGDV
ncbi:right-handed parallel beta-helix repeat-containing protein [Salinilacihabitans rarus]|uniref:right-handed parallel beta-helix repeat-containing protein n=1 Tax=Salinilacihabitans rarus TaxID=2961596 RepID=UPI0020C8E520|nr:right-handed parallel beta-helix repeat-containing protein [Salinilacihabitans rarus]